MGAALDMAEAGIGQFLRERLLPEDPSWTASWIAPVEDEGVLEKVRVAERCLGRVRDEFGGDPAP